MRAPRRYLRGSAVHLHHHVPRRHPDRPGRIRQQAHSRHRIDRSALRRPGRQRPLHRRVRQRERPIYPQGRSRDAPTREVRSHRQAGTPDRPPTIRIRRAGSLHPQHELSLLASVPNACGIMHLTAKTAVTRRRSDKGNARHDWRSHSRARLSDPRNADLPQFAGAAYRP